jgi:uncharacterized protein YigE (DUF2233 family)
MAGQLAITSRAEGGCTSSIAARVAATFICCPFADEVTKRPEFATQSGPMLVINGEMHPKFDQDGDSRNIRNAVGVDDHGRAHFVISEYPLSFGRLARYYRDQIKVKNALFLDGNVSSLWDRPSGRIDQAVPIGPLIVIEKAAKAEK